MKTYFCYIDSALDMRRRLTFWRLIKELTKTTINVCKFFFFFFFKFHINRKEIFIYMYINTHAYLMGLKTIILMDKHKSTLMNTEIKTIEHQLLPVI